LSKHGAGFFQQPAGIWRQHAEFCRLIAAALGFELVVELRLRRVAAWSDPSAAIRPCPGTLRAPRAGAATRVDAAGTSDATYRPGAGNGGDAAAPRSPPHGAYVRPLHYAWADLLRRTCAIDVLACPECGGRLRLLATIEYTAVVEKILRHLGLPIEPPVPARARAPTWPPSVLPEFESDADASAAWAH